LELKELSDQMRSSKLVKDRSHILKKHPKCFIGSEAVTFFLTTPHCKTITEAEALGQQMMDADMIHHVFDEHPFKNESWFYRFRNDEEVKSLSVAKVTKDGPVAAQGDLIIKGTLFWNKRYFVLRSDEKKLYYFETSLSSFPSKVIDLANIMLEVAECPCKTGSYCFTITDGKNSYVLCAEASKVQLAWLQTLTDMGVKFREDETIKTSGNSIYDFSANDIDGNLVSLDRYKGSVCLVVNVASF